MNIVAFMPQTPPIFLPSVLPKIYCTFLPVTRQKYHSSYLKAVFVHWKPFFFFFWGSSFKHITPSISGSFLSLPSGKLNMQLFHLLKTTTAAKHLPSKPLPSPIHSFTFLYSKISTKLLPLLIGSLLCLSQSRSHHDHTAEISLVKALRLPY